MGQERAGGLVPRDVIEAEAAGLVGRQSEPRPQCRRGSGKGTARAGRVLLGPVPRLVHALWPVPLRESQPGTPREVGRPQVRARQVLPVSVEVELCWQGVSPPGTPGEAVLHGERGEAGGLGRALLRRAHRLGGAAGEAQAEPSRLCHWHWGVRGARRNQDPESRGGGGRLANALPASTGEGTPGAELPQRPPGCFPTCCCFRLNACFSPPPYPGFSYFGFRTVRKLPWVEEGWE